MKDLTSRGILKSQTNFKTTSPTPNGSVYNSGPWSDNLKTTTITGSMLNKDKTKRAIKSRPKMSKDLPEARVGEDATLVKPGDNPKRQALMNILQK